MSDKYQNKIFDVIIIGCASAGMSAGIYAARKKLNTLILTKEVGGQSLLTGHIENYPGFKEISGPELVKKMQKHLEKFSVPILENKEVVNVGKENGTFFAECKDDSQYKARSLIIASGKVPRHLNVPGEKEYTSKGISYCATCDAPMFEGKKVAVIGGGNAGLDTAYDLLPYAEKIYLLELGPKIAGDELMQEKLKKSGKVEFITNAKTTAIKGNQLMNKLVYKDTKTNEEKILDVEGAFVNVGWKTSSDFAKDFLELNKYGEIVVDPATGAASVEGAFAAGDISSTPYEQCIVAAGEGAVAALSVYNYLSGKK